MCNILVVEDDHALRAAVTSLLDEAGYHVVPAGTVEEGLTLLGGYDFDVALVDLLLPNGNGMRVVEAIDGRVATIVLTGLAIPEEAMHRGVAAYLEKPYDEEDLIATIDSVAPELSKGGNKSQGRTIGDSVDIAAVYSKLAAVSARVQQLLSMKGDLSKVKNDLAGLKQGFSDLEASVDTMQGRCEERGLKLAVLGERSKWQKEGVESNEQRIQDFLQDNQGVVSSGISVVGFVVYLYGKGRGWW